MSEMRTRYCPIAGVLFTATLDGFGDLDRNLDFAAIPNATRISRNGYDEPDTARVELDARLIPFDPEQIRGAGIQVYMLDAPHLGAEVDWLLPEYMRFVGVVDDVAMNMGGDGSAVSIQASDLTAVFSEADWDGRDKVRSGVRLDAEIQRMLDLVQSRRVASNRRDGATPITVEWRGTRPAAEVIIGAGRKARHRQSRAVRPGLNVWDVISETCLREGYIVYVDGYSAVIRDTTTNRTEGITAMAYGRNLETFEVSRSFGKTIVAQVIGEARLPGASGRKGEYAREAWPQNPSLERRRSGLGVDPEKRKTIHFQNVASREDLRRRTRLAFERMARGESKYGFSTPHMSDLRGVDLLDLKTGDSVQIAWDAFNGEALRQLPVGKRIDALRGLGYRDSVAVILANNLDKLRQLGQPYYASEVELGLDESGFELSVRAMNFAVEGREGEGIDAT